MTRCETIQFGQTSSCCCGHSTACTWSGRARDPERCHLTHFLRLCSVPEGSTATFHSLCLCTVYCQQAESCWKQGGQPHQKNLTGQRSKAVQVWQHHDLNIDGAGHWSHGAGCETAALMARRNRANASIMDHSAPHMRGGESSGTSGNGRPRSAASRARRSCRSARRRPADHRPQPSTTRPVLQGPARPHQFTQYYRRCSGKAAQDLCRKMEGQRRRQGARHERSTRGTRQPQRPSCQGATGRDHSQ